MEALQGAEIAAWAVQTALEVLHDAHLAARDFFLYAPSTDGETMPFPRLPWIAPYMPQAIRRPAPQFGEDNDYILREVLGLSDQEIESLVAERTIAWEQEPPPYVVPT